MVASIFLKMQMYKFNPKCRGIGVVDVGNVEERYVSVTSEEPRCVFSHVGLGFWFFTCAFFECLF